MRLKCEQRWAETFGVDVEITQLEDADGFALPPNCVVDQVLCDGALVYIVTSPTANKHGDERAAVGAQAQLAVQRARDISSVVDAWRLMCRECATTVRRLCARDPNACEAYLNGTGLSMIEQFGVSNDPNTRYEIAKLLEILASSEGSSKGLQPRLLELLKKIVDPGIGACHNGDVSMDPESLQCGAAACAAFIALLDKGRVDSKAVLADGGAKAVIALLRACQGLDGDGDQDGKAEVVGTVMKLCRRLAQDEEARDTLIQDGVVPALLPFVRMATLVSLDQPASAADIPHSTSATVVELLSAFCSRTASAQSAATPSPFSSTGFNFVEKGAAIGGQVQGMSDGGPLGQLQPLVDSQDNTLVRVAAASFSVQLSTLSLPGKARARQQFYSANGMQVLWQLGTSGVAEAELVAARTAVALASLRFEDKSRVIEGPALSQLMRWLVKAEMKPLANDLQQHAAAAIAHLVLSDEIRSQLLELDTGGGVVSALMLLVTDQESAVEARRHAAKALVNMLVSMFVKEAICENAAFIQFLKNNDESKLRDRDGVLYAYLQTLADALVNQSD
ncbi:hypothetical protein CYMTET_12749 [Cymbomonas tetramitiformis]|uniref:Uncharacterized protein n=1 Tax=Cymbomonas tetramitiformis TaxID=36881 RepID=A0AAE0LBQ9_9CHLO|nr:hypothetical protein CYMTET_12749 [Cymbomonas tetramitiformis]